MTYRFILYAKIFRATCMSTPATGLLQAFISSVLQHARNQAYMSTEMTRWNVRSIRSHTGRLIPSFCSLYDGTSDVVLHPPADINVESASFRSPAYPKTSAIYCGYQLIQAQLGFGGGDKPSRLCQVGD